MQPIMEIYIQAEGPSACGAVLWFRLRMLYVPGMMDESPIIRSVVVMAAEGNMSARSNTAKSFEA